ncbi:uncharacterized protein [Watersipora subatra]
MSHKTSVRCDTPDPRVSGFPVEDVATLQPKTDISSDWRYMGTNNSAQNGGSFSRSLPSDVSWMRGSTPVHNVSQLNYSNFKHKRHWPSDDRFLDDPPCKMRINEEKVAQQFHNMSLFSDVQASTSNVMPETDAGTVSAMWDHYHNLEQKLESCGDIEIDEGVDMGGDIDSVNSSENIQDPVLHILPDLKSKLAVNKNVLPQILVPKPCKEVVLWQPSGVEFIKDGSSSTNLDTLKAKRKKKTATRTLSTNLLSVPTVRPDTPPPNASANPLSHDIPVCFVDEMGCDAEMDMQ